jgi:hypothetical protein
MAEDILPGLSEAEVQSRFNELLDGAACGEALIITRNGLTELPEPAPGLDPSSRHQPAAA